MREEERKEEKLRGECGREEGGEKRNIGGKRKRGGCLLCLFFT